MIDKIGSSTSLVPRAQTSLVRNTDVLNAVQQSSQRSSGSAAPVKIFAVPQSAKGSATTKTRLPRGSLLDVLA